MTPTVGRIVHYVAFGTPGGEFPAGEHRAAIITEVSKAEYLAIDQEDGTALDPELAVGLCILNPTGMYFARGVQFSASWQPGTYHWPEGAPVLEEVQQIRAKQDAKAAAVDA